MTLQKDPEGNETHHLNSPAFSPEQRVLEIGCGDGRLTWEYARFAGYVTGIDLEAEEVKLALADRPADLKDTVSFARANAVDLPFPHETFNQVILAWSL